MWLGIQATPQEGIIVDCIINKNKQNKNQCEHCRPLSENRQNQANFAISYFCDLFRVIFPFFTLFKIWCGLSIVFGSFHFWFEIIISLQAQQKLQGIPRGKIVGHPKRKFGGHPKSMEDTSRGKFGGHLMRKVYRTPQEESLQNTSRGKSIGHRKRKVCRPPHEESL